MEPVNDNPQAAVAFCRACGKGLMPEQVHNYQGTVYCAEHVPQVAGPQAGDGGANPYVQPPGPPLSSVSPGWAFVLGLIPGVGAIYNGQYAKGFVHALITGVLFSLADHGAGSTQTLVEFMIPVWILYMAFEAYHTAKKRLLGEMTDEFSSIFPNANLQTGFPVLPVLLIVVGVVFLLDNLQWLNLRALKPYAMPLIMIALGVFLLFARLKANAQIRREAHHERS
ncbi:MAG: hypothetical protein JNK48_16420 [Bryobacterales bacterium]|nr:hypothetical protein [Bryobacterales bacterium]